MRSIRTFPAFNRKYRKLCKSKTCHTVFGRQGTLTFPLGDDVMGPILFHTGEHQYTESVWALSRIRHMGYRTDNFWDIGANIGHIGLGLLKERLVRHVTAIEPSVVLGEYLDENVRQSYWQDDVRVLNLAVGDRNDLVWFKPNDANFGDGRVYSDIPTESVLDASWVLSMRLSNLILRDVDKKPDVVWMDVQGREGLVLRGSSGWLVGIPTVMEVWPAGMRETDVSLSEFSQACRENWSNFQVIGSDTVHPISRLPRLLQQYSGRRFGRSKHADVLFW